MGDITELGSFASLLDDDPIKEPSVEEPVAQDDYSPNFDNLEEDEGVEEEAPPVQKGSMYAFLQSRGVSDPSKIKFEGEDGEIEERNFDDLSEEEQLEILATVTNDGYSDYEKSVINHLRSNNTTLEDMMQQYANTVLQQYIAEQGKDQQQAFVVDDYSDDDLYVADLREEHPSWSEEEILAKFEAAKDNEGLFAKEVAEIREKYKSIEEENMKAAQEREQQQYSDLQASLQEAVGRFNEVLFDAEDPESDSIEIEENEKPELLAYLMNQGPDGKSQLVRDLENPDALIELAWLRTKGADVLAGASRYWKDELKQARAENRKLQAQLDKITKRNDSSVVIPSKQESSSKSMGSAWDNSKLF